MEVQLSTRDRLIRLIKETGGTTLAELRGRTGLSRSTLRDHLARLAQSGIVENMVEKRSFGRPPLVYRLTDQMIQSPPVQTQVPGPITFSFVGIPRDPALLKMAVGLRRIFESQGHRIQFIPDGEVRLVFNFIDPRRPRPFRRRGQGTFVISITVTDEPVEDVLKQAYPLLIRSLANLCIYLVRTGEGVETYFVTLEQGHYPVPALSEDGYYDYLYQRLLPLASSELVINNEFVPDLPRELWEGDELTRQLAEAGRRLDALDLLPTPFPIQELLPEQDWRHVTRLFGLGGLSYGNLSVRRDATTFWMSASGVDKGKMQLVGRDMLLVKGFDPARRRMLLSVPPHVEPRRVSVDAIEHWMIYTEHPSVGAIVHVHAWMEGVASTTMNYPCGTRQLAQAVADLVREAPDPACAVVGLRNHGLTITGPTLDDVFDRLERGFIRQVPMS
jgi:ribulose-5-phosphate 4-epimerase/fuculose-1-phosphate aldolase/DNA-binding transcriptional ArsR family regulator